MAVRRGGLTFWVGFVSSPSRRRPIHSWSWTLSQVTEQEWVCQNRPLSSAAWALAPPNSLRYQINKQPLLSHPRHHASQQRPNVYEDDWEESLGVCVLVPPGESHDVHSLLELPVLRHVKPGELHGLGAHSLLGFSFPLAAVDGSREDDIIVESLQTNGADAVKGERLFEAEGPAWFLYTSHLHCFDCLGTQKAPTTLLKPCRDGGLNRTGELFVLPTVSLSSYRAEEEVPEGEHEGEEKLTVMYERLRVELPRFFVTNHDYSLYSNEVEFINGLMNMKTRGRVVYQLTLSLWRFLCLCYYTEARLDVLKLTKHVEDGTIKARWRIKGLPFHSMILRFYRKDKSHLYRSFDAFSTFYVGHDGLIHCHKVEKVMPAQPPVLPRVTSLLSGALVALGVQEHRPALNLLPLLLSSLRQSRN